MKSEVPTIMNPPAGPSSTKSGLVKSNGADPGLELRHLYPEAFQHTDVSKIRFQCGKGWLGIIRTLCSLLAENNRLEEKEKTYLTDAKEKLGTLRIMVSGRSQIVSEWIRFAEQHSTHACEICGCSARLIYKDSWQRVRCDTHISSPVAELID